jgi:uncharacterized membrane protein
VIILIPNHPELELLTSGFQVVVGTLCPFVLILACNITIIVTLQSASEERKVLEMMKQDKSRDRNKKDTAYLTRMLIAVSFAYVILTLPFRLNHLIMKIPDVASMYDMKNIYWRMRYVVQAWTLQNVWMFNDAINFILYCIGGGKRYRRDAKDVWKGLVCC